MNKAPQKMPVGKLKLDGGTQPRATLDPVLVDDYAEAMKGGAKFPPVVAFYDGSDYWLADGFHRARAAERNGGKVSVEVRQGTRRDAQWYSFGANKDHGQRRTSGDTARAIKAILLDKDWRKTSQAQIAKHVGVSPQYVSKVKASINQLIDRPVEQEVQRGASTYIQNTANIGKRQSSGPSDYETPSPGLRKERARGRAAREHLERETQMSLGFRGAYEAMEHQIALCREERFRGETTIEAARACVRQLNGLVESDLT